MMVVSLLRIDKFWLYMIELRMSVYWPAGSWFSFDCSLNCCLWWQVFTRYFAEIRISM